MRDLTGLARKAASQHGLLSTAQIVELASSRRAPADLVETGILERVRRGVYRMAGAPVSYESEVMVVCLSTSRLVVGSHRTSLRLWDFRSVDDEVEVSVRYPANVTAPGAIVHRSRDLTEHDFTFINAIPVTTPARTLCDAGLIFPEDEVMRMTHHGIARGLVTAADLWAYRRRVGRQGRNGVGVLDRVLRSLPPNIAAAESGPEIEMARMFVDHGLPEPVCQHPVVACGRRYRIDFAYPEHRLAIEYDGFRAHATPEGFARDSTRQNDLQQCGWTVLRFTWHDLRTSPAGVARRIRHFLVP